MYNPYNPYAYLYPNQQIPTQPAFQPPVNAMNTQPVQQNNSPVVLQVSTIKQVEQAPVQPGGKALVLVANEPVIAMRTADNMGITSTDYYHIERFDPDAHTQNSPTDFVTREELQQALAGLVQQMHEEFPTVSAKEDVKK